MERYSTIIDYAELATRIKAWGRTLGFQRLAVSDTDLSLAEQQFNHWLMEGNHGEMAYMARHGSKRSRPGELVPGTRRIISVRMNYRPAGDNPLTVLSDPALGYVSRYALGRDYHKLMRNRLQQLAKQIEQAVGPFGYRAFVDSAPVLEKAIAARAGLGWQGKHSNLVAREAGCWFFLGELYTDLPLPVDPPMADHCGSCTACIDCCPTGAIVAPYRVDARRCISYLTIELEGSIPEPLRPLLGNRVYGCDDCLLACPWNRFSRPSREQGFLPRNGLESSQLIELFHWTEAQFLKRLEGSPIRRIGHLRWLRNIAVALGNAPSSPAITAALRAHLDHPSEMVREHVRWALDQ
jgi:epoxyqueuosine reductase